MNTFKVLVIGKDFKGWWSNKGSREIELKANSKEEAKLIVSKMLKEGERITDISERL